MDFACQCPSVLADHQEMDSHAEESQEWCLIAWDNMKAHLMPTCLFSTSVEIIVSYRYVNVSIRFTYVFLYLCLFLILILNWNRTYKSPPRLLFGITCVEVFYN